MAALSDLDKARTIFKKTVAVLPSIEIPEENALSACKNIAKVLPYRVLPRPSIRVKKGTVGKISVTGGAAPYSAHWVNRLPKDVTLQEADAAQHGSGFLIDASRATEPNTPFELIIDDANGQTATVTVLIEE